MRYWWVNQNQTYKHEVSGGYLWSPKARADGVRNYFYDTMTEVVPGDLVFSFSDTLIKAVGVVLGEAQTAAKPDAFGSSGKSWGDIGWYVPVDFKLVEQPIRPKDLMSQLLPTLPKKYSPLQPNGKGNQVYLTEIPEDMAKVLFTALGHSIDTLLSPALAVLNAEVADDKSQVALLARQDIAETEKEQLVRARRGQGLFRSRVELIEPQCRLTGVRQKVHLRASHIKPWRDSTDAEKLDGHNGLLLAPHVDHLFDRGFVSFSDGGDLLISSKLDAEVLIAWGLNTKKHVGSFTTAQQGYLDYHRRNVFQI